MSCFCQRLLFGVLLLGALFFYGCLAQQGMPPVENETPVFNETPSNNETESSGTPYCSALGTRSEGWYIKGRLIKYANCTGCTARCEAIGTRSEGWYSSCDGSLIMWEQCAGTHLPERFCGWSTYGSCSSDSDCRVGGCSGQVCQSKYEESVITTCEYRECYNARAYGLSCECIAGRCQWN
ncbi:MAG: eight-cysteine-cluster domain-containing protein [Candidatus Bilamarchaeaceae archaeon]